MRTIFIDIETRSTANLRTAGHFRYAAHAETEVLCVGLAVDDGAPIIWRPGDPVPNTWLRAAHDPDDWTIVAHHASFELAILRHILVPRHKWPEIATRHWRCTMAAALAAALPGSLEGAAAALGLPVTKDAAGKRLMMQMSRPRKARRGEDASLLHWFDDDERRKRLDLYCARDVEVARALFRRLPPLSPIEQRLWRLDRIINRRGLAVDLDLVRTADRWARRALGKLAGELATVTGGSVTSPTQLARMAAWCGAEQGVRIASFTAENVVEILANGGLPPPFRRALEIRQAAAGASVKKFRAMLDWADKDGRLRGLYRFHGAATGRWSGSGPQPQNLRRLDSDPGPALAALEAGSYAKFKRAFPNVLDTLGGLARPMIVAGKGRQLIGADFKLIEVAVMAWLCGDAEKIETLRRIFAGEGEDLHTMTAAKLFRVAIDKVTPEQRSAGKVANFACQYQGGVAAVMKVARDYSITLDEAKSESVKTAWRAANPAAVRFWARIERAALAAAWTPGRVTECGPLRFRRGPDDFLRLRLPSGRKISFPRPRLAAGRNGDSVVAFHDNAGGKFLPRHGYGGLFTENAVSGTARDLLRAAMFRLDERDFRIVAHTHDEIVAEVLRGFDAIEEFRALMGVVPRWAAGLPVACETWGPSKRYEK